MCGIAGIYALDNKTRYKDARRHLNLMNNIQKHRGPDGQKIWIHDKEIIGLGHNRLSIIDIQGGSQPMMGPNKNVLSFNGEIYNYKDLKRAFSGEYSFTTKSDTEIILASYMKWGVECVEYFSGMFAFILWDEEKQRLFCARDHFGIKPLYYAVLNGILYIASEAKTLLPFLPEVEVSLEALQEYLHFQLYIKQDACLFKNIHVLPPGCTMIVENGEIKIKPYFNLKYSIDETLSEKECIEKLKELLPYSVNLHKASDVPISTYLSGGIDSGIITALVSRMSTQEDDLIAFTGKFSTYKECDESSYARAIGEKYDIKVFEQDITANDFINNLEKIIYHLDYPVAGPGVFPQYMLSGMVAQHRKVVFGGQGGDEIFGGYSRYLVSYLTSYIAASINGSVEEFCPNIDHNKFIANLSSLKNYKMLINNLWPKNLFESPDIIYYNLINRFDDSSSFINKNIFGSRDFNLFEKFQAIFNSDNVVENDIFNKMLNFDSKVLLPALLQVEDRVSMAHGVESRVPFLEKNLAVFAATIPVHIKFSQGNLKNILKKSFSELLPKKVLNRKDKMGFPVPLNHWLHKEIKDFSIDIFSSSKAKQRGIFDCASILSSMSTEGKGFNRAFWGAISLEVWHKKFLDNTQHFKNLLKNASEPI
jgi:asparagine synthase (glutamine-hydrolysing)